MLNRRSFLQIVPLGLLFGPRLLAREGVEADSPEAVARLAFDVLKAGRIDELMEMIGQERLEHFRSTTMEWMETAAREQQDEQVCSFFGVRQVAELRTLDAAQFFAAWWRGATRSVPETLRGLDDAEIRVIGHVRESADIAHVLFRIRLPGAREFLDVPRVMTLQNADSGWGLCLDSGLEAESDLGAPNAASDSRQPPQSTIRVLGSLMENEDTAHVVYRATISFGSARMTKTYVLPVNPEAPEWAMVARGDAVGLADRIQRLYGLE